MFNTFIKVLREKSIDVLVIGVFVYTIENDDRILVLECLLVRRTGVPFVGIGIHQVITIHFISKELLLLGKEHRQLFTRIEGMESKNCVVRLVRSIRHIPRMLLYRLKNAPLK